MDLDDQVDDADDNQAKLMLVLIKKLEKIFIAPQVRSELYETGNCTIVQFQRAKHAGFLIQYLNQETV